MSRVKGGKAARKKRKHLLQHTKGFHWGRKAKYRAAKEALYHAWQHSFQGRKEKKREYRKIWNIQINAECRKLGLNYSTFIAGLKKHKIELDRKILSQIAQDNPQIFEKIVAEAKN